MSLCVLRTDSLVMPSEYIKEFSCTLPQGTQLTNFDVVSSARSMTVTFWGGGA